MKSLEFLKQQLQKLGPLPEEEFDKLLPFAQAQSIAKNEFWLREGDPATHFVFLYKGFMKAFYTTLSGGAYIRNFAFEGEFLAPYTGLLTGQQALVSIQAIEDSDVISFPYQKLVDLREGHRCWETISRRIAEIYYVMRERRQYQLLTQDAATRYSHFKSEVGENLGRISSQDVAAYIGITPVSLSRIRASQKPK